jgi:hypothetical protein
MDKQTLDTVSTHDVALPEDEVQGYAYFSPAVKTAGQMACWGFAGMGAAATGPLGAFAFGAAAQYCSAQWE